MSTPMRWDSLSMRRKLMHRSGGSSRTSNTPEADLAAVQAERCGARHNGDVSRTLPLQHGFLSDDEYLRLWHYRQADHDWHPSSRQPARHRFVAGCQCLHAQTDGLERQCLFQDGDCGRRRGERGCRATCRVIVSVAAWQERFPPFSAPDAFSHGGTFGHGNQNNLFNN